MFNKFYTTLKGQQYIAKSMEDGKKLALTRGVFGDGVKPSGFYPISSTALIHKLGDMGLTIKTASATEMRITSHFTNRSGNGVLPAFNLTEMGICGKIQNSDGTDDTSYPETLLFYGVGTVAESDHIPDTLTEFLINWSVEISGEATIVTVIDESLVYATLKDVSRIDASMEKMLMDSLKGYIAVETPSHYSGPAGDYGIEIGKIEGKSEQVTTTGKNICPSFPNATSNGITLTLLDDGGISLTGTAGTGHANFVVSANIPAGSYVFSANNPSGIGKDTSNSPYIAFRDKSGTWMMDKAFTAKSMVQTFTPANDIATVLLAIPSGVTLKDFKLHLQVERGSVVTSFEPYTGDMPAPSPDYPQEIKSFGDETVNFHSRGFQLFDASKLINKTQDGATVVNNGDGSFTISGSGLITTGYSNIVNLTHAETVDLLKVGKLSLKSGITNPYSRVGLIGSNGNIATITNLDYEETSFNITKEMLDDEGFYISIGFYGLPDIAIKRGTVKPMLYQDGDGTWEEYKEPKKTAVALTEPLRSLPNGVCDTYEDGKIIRRVIALTFDGSSDEAYSFQTEYGSVARFNFSRYEQKPVMSLAYCTHFAIGAIGTADLECFNIHGEKGYPIIQIASDRLESVDAEGLRTWLTANPITVLYELAEPTIEEIEIPTIPSYAPHTSVHHDSEVAPTSIEWRIKNAPSTDHTHEPDELGLVDYIVERGTQDGWKYKKYASGEMVARKTVNISNYTLSNVIQGVSDEVYVYSGLAPNIATAPSDMLTVEDCRANLVSGGGWLGRTSCSSKKVSTIVFGPISDSPTIVVDVELTGTWK